MKKIFALLMVLLMCLSLAACGKQEPEVNLENGQQNGGGNQNPTLEEILCSGEWYYLGLRTPGGLVFEDNGTISGGIWTLNGTTLDCVWKNGTTSRFEIRNIRGSYFMTDEEGITLYLYETKPDWYTYGYMAYQVVTRAWEDHLEVACVNGEYRLQLKKQYMQALLDDGNYVDICYSQGDHQQVQVRLNFDPDSYYVKIENPADAPLEIISAEGVLSILTDLM